MTRATPPERTFVSRCPSCQRLMADTAKPHCDWKTNNQCDWMHCKCGATISQDGIWVNGTRRGVAS